MIPEAKIMEATAKIYDLQNPGSKMSKSGESPQGILWLLDDDAVLIKKIKSAVTDTERDIVFDPINKPGVSNLLSIYSLATGMSAKESEAHFAGKGYGDLKGEVAEAVVEVFAPIRERTHELLSDPAELDRLLASGAERAQEIAQTTLARVYDAVGFLKASH